MEDKSNNIRGNVDLDVRTKSNKFPTVEHIQQIENDVGKLQFHCKKCKKTFNSRSTIYYHLGCANDAAKKFKCDKCNKSFSTRSHFLYHMESHSTNLHSCSHCKKLFSNRIVLKKHEKQHGAIVYDCKECNKTFRSKASFSSHLQHHTNQLQYGCNICDKKYSSKSTLQQHMLKHFTKKFVCSTCGKRFQRNSTLRLHSARHSNNEKVACSICSKNFSDRSALMRHIKLHENVNRFKCKICDISCIRKDNMLRHIRNIHPGEEFKTCVEIINPKLWDGNETQIPACDANNIITACPQSTSSDLNLPKTVENSSVIKCIGNVEPVKIPSLTVQIKETSSKNQEKSNNINASTNISKKLRRRYDPIEMYKKILLPEDDNPDDDNFEVINDSSLNGSNLVKKSENVTSQRTTYNSAKFMHWRKNYKYTYEYQDY